ncbi:MULTISPECIES: hypothetical protein [Rhizobium]|uniref:Uncharacterized protein n=1 Tax=Rhizobium wenxiniae TaxID=1737357 RepID=A0A7W9YCQ7_9HYPH|nr:hypothetical protein [Rhizobium wenxiniae]MBB6166189.1 hypothetical protein [Rhizobium wenxiniae]GGG21508.1 hypothetical protein GCM10010924_58660 [Rhizobium wenxiniae]
METKSFTAEIDRSDISSERFKVVALNDPTGDDVTDVILDPAVVYNDKDALQVAVAGKLGLEYQDVAVEMQGN